MDSTVTIGEVSFKLTSQQPTGNVRQAVVSNQIRRLITHHATSTVKGIGPVNRTLRKIEFDESVTNSDGSVVKAPVSVALVITRPEICSPSVIDLPLSTLLAYAGQADFVAAVKEDQI